MAERPQGACSKEGLAEVPLPSPDFRIGEGPENGRVKKEEVGPSQGGSLESSK